MAPRLGIEPGGLVSLRWLPNLPCRADWGGAPFAANIQYKPTVQVCQLLYTRNEMVGDKGRNDTKPLLRDEYASRCRVE
jgi:hypothetical protein